jgi:hypothetical protein
MMWCQINQEALVSMLVVGRLVAWGEKVMLVSIEVIV